MYVNGYEIEEEKSLAFQNAFDVPEPEDRIHWQRKKLRIQCKRNVMWHQ